MAGTHRDAHRAAPVIREKKIKVKTKKPKRFGILPPRFIVSLLLQSTRSDNLRVDYGKFQNRPVCPKSSHIAPPLELPVEEPYH